MLVAQDDTMWLMQGALRLLLHYSSLLPYAVSDFSLDGPFFLEHAETWE